MVLQLIQDVYTGIYILAIPPPREIFVRIEKQGKFEGGLHEKRKGEGGKRRKRKRVIKHTLNTFMKLK